MIKKNTFRFVAFTAAALGVSLLVSGCGDSGSTTPNDLNAKYGKVTFNYNVLAASAAKATDVQAEIVTVKYAFYGLKEGGARFVSGPETNASYVHTFVHGDKDTAETVTVNNVSTYATHVVASYYDKDGKLVAAGQNDISFGTSNTVEVTEPEVAEVKEVELLASNHVVALNGETNLVVAGTIGEGDEEKDLNLTAFADIKGIDAETLKPYYESEMGITYTGIKYGTVSDAYAEIGGEKYALENPIYATDQTVAALEVVPDGDTPCSIYDRNKIELLYAPDKDSEGKVVNGSFGLNFVDLYKVEDTEFKEVSLVAAVNSVPLQVPAVYTNEDGKGPQPQNIDLLAENDSNLKLNIIPGNEDGDASLLQIDDLGVLQLKGLNYELGKVNSYRVEAVYGEGEDAPTDSLEVEAADGQPSLQLCAITPEGITYAPNINILDNDKVTVNLALYGCLTFSRLFQSQPIAVSESIIAADAYPAAKPIDSEHMTFVQNEKGANDYTFDYDGSEDVHNSTLDLEAIENAPTFVPSEVIAEGIIIVVP
ncbi:MAG: hypothetical protein ACI376_08130 [Candidatus Bruticola sp.]